MTILSSIHEGIQETTAQIARIEQVLASSPHPGLMLSLASLKKQQKQLDDELNSAASNAGMDVCRYRFIGAGTRIASNVFTAMVEFQQLFTLVFAARRAGAPRARVTMSEEERNMTGFGLSYIFTGSLGVVLTLPNQRLLFGYNELDDSMLDLFRLMRSTHSEEIRSFAQRLGIAPIRELFRWSRTHVDHRLGADIKWQRGEEVHSSLLIQRQEFQQLLRIIDETSDEVTEELTISGTLFGADVSPKRFHFRTRDGKDIRGKYDDAIDVNQPAQIPGQYRATLTKTTIVKYSTEEEQVHYQLDRLESMQ